MLRRAAEEARQFQSQKFSDEGSRLTSLQAAESILQTLAGDDRDAGAFTTLELDSDNEESVAYGIKAVTTHRTIRWKMGRTTHRRRNQRKK